MFKQGDIQEMPESMVIKMMGRAGRQQYNTSGRVYILTTEEKEVSKKRKLRTICVNCLTVYKVHYGHFYWDFKRKMLIVAISSNPEVDLHSLGMKLLAQNQFL